ncbi:PspC domain-containing protein [Patescibacteria group bacterium AH-259-L07]|nr:PspC domain-containing protein [Patescibacteria group bacterium AH-259-L07]
MAQKKGSKKLYRSRKNRIIAGVCGGLGEYLSVDPIVVRIVFVLLLFFDGLGLILYLVLLVVVPLKPGADIEVNREEKVEELLHGVRDRARALAKEFKYTKNKKK